MTAETKDLQAITGRVVPEFTRFVAPSVFGLLAVSSATVIDGIFIGNFVGATALASVNLAMPFLALVFGVLIMVSLGGAVVAGKSLGEGKTRTASNLFSKTGIVATLVMAAFSLISLVFTEEIVALLGAHGITVRLSAEYLWVSAWFFPCLGVAVLFSQFTRVDGRPVLSFFGMLGMTLTNIVFDYILVAWMGWGLTGAAIATGLSYVSTALILVFHFLGRKANLRMIVPFGSWMDIPRASLNGFSECLNETSSGVGVLIFNWILMTQVGAMGVAAFTIVDYVIYFGVLTFFGVSEGIMPLISVNFGGRKPDRILKFLFLGVGLNVVIGTALIALLLVWPDQLISVFLSEDAPKIRNLSVSIIAVIWPMFLFNGANIAISAYFTGMHCAKQSAQIAFMRSLALPAGLVFVFWHVFGFMGVFYALPIAEAVTLAMAVYLLRTRLPAQLMGRT